MASLLGLTFGCLVLCSPQDAFATPADPLSAPDTDANSTRNKPPISETIWGALAQVAPSDPPTAGASNDSPKPLTQLRLPIPDPESQKTAVARIKQLFRDDYLSAKQPADKLVLAKKLLQLGVEETQDPTTRFVLWSESRDLALAGGDRILAFTAIDSLASKYEFDHLSMKCELLADAVRTTRSTLARHAIAIDAEELMVFAASKDQFELALRFGTVALQAAPPATASEFRKKLLASVTDVRQHQDEYTVVQPAITVLRNNPDDPPANLAYGKYRCLSKNDWTNGLPILAKGADDPLAILARQDLAGAKDTDAQVALGNKWWDMADAIKGNQKTAVQSRAAHWYSQAVGQLNGLSRVEVTKKLALVTDANTKAAPPREILQAQKMPIQIIKGQWGVNGNHLTYSNGQRDGMLTVRQALPRQFVLEITGIPALVSDTTLIALYVKSGGKEFIVQLARDGSCVLADGIDPRTLRKARYGNVFNQGQANVLSYSFSQGILTVDVNGVRWLEHRDNALGSSGSDSFNLGILGSWDIARITLADK